MNIGYPPFIGGAQLFLREIARRSSRRGHEVVAYVSNAQEVEYLWSRAKAHLAPGQVVDEGVVVRRFAVRHLPLLPYSYHALRRLVIEMNQQASVSEATLWHWAHYTPWLPDLEQALHQEKGLADLVHAWNIPFESLLRPAWQYARRHGIPFVVTPLIHLGEQDSDHVRRFYTMRHQMALLRDSDAVIALTPIEAQYLIAQGVAPERVHVIGGGMDEAPLRQGDANRFRARYHIQGPFVLYLGAVSYEKGATHLVQAMAKLWPERTLSLLGRGQGEGFEADLVLAGQPMEHFLAFHRRLPPEQQMRCHLLGPLTEEDKADALAACDLLAMPSRTESFGLVYLEAWALGKPVIGARAGAVPAVIEDGVDGLLVPFGDVTALAKSLSALLGDPKRARALGEAGQRKVRERFRWDLVEDRVEQVYQLVRKPRFPENG